MTHVIQDVRSLGEQVADLLDRMPQNYDVTFSVGPDKVSVKAVKIILKAVSRVFQEEFDSKWENGVLKEGDGIPLPDVDPTSFETFVKLITSDKWSVDALNALNMSPNTKLSLLGLCRRYEITKAIKNLEEIVKLFLSKSFADYKDTPEFLETSLENLETIFACDELPLDEKEIFECACRWASNQCTLQGFQSTGENYRKVLGNCLFEIRFPTMSTEEFARVCLFKKDLLKKDEQLAIFLFKGLNFDEESQLQFKLFKTNPRKSFGFSVLSMPEQFKPTTSPSFVCNGTAFGRAFQVSQNISLHGVGFLGPIDRDTRMDVTVQIRRRFNYEDTFDSFDSETFKKNIFARKGKTFYFVFDKPIIVEHSTYDRDWGSYYAVYFTLKGTNNLSQYMINNPKDESFQASGVEFHLNSGWNNKNPMGQLLFKKI